MLYEHHNYGYEVLAEASGCLIVSLDRFSSPCTLLQIVCSVFLSPKLA